MAAPVERSSNSEVVLADIESFVDAFKNPRLSDHQRLRDLKKEYQKTPEEEHPHLASLLLDDPSMRDILIEALLLEPVHPVSPFLVQFQTSLAKFVEYPESVRQFIRDLFAEGMKQGIPVDPGYLFVLSGIHQNQFYHELIENGCMSQIIGENFGVEAVGWTERRDSIGRGELSMQSEELLRRLLKDPFAHSFFQKKLAAIFKGEEKTTFSFSRAFLQGLSHIEERQNVHRQILPLGFDKSTALEIACRGLGDEHETVKRSLLLALFATEDFYEKLPAIEDSPVKGLAEIANLPVEEPFKMARGGLYWILAGSLHSGKAFKLNTLAELFLATGDAFPLLVKSQQGKSNYEVLSEGLNILLRTLVIAGQREAFSKALIAYSPEDSTWFFERVLESYREEIESMGSSDSESYKRLANAFYFFATLPKLEGSFLAAINKVGEKNPSLKEQYLLLACAIPQQNNPNSKRKAQKRK